MTDQRTSIEIEKSQESDDRPERSPDGLLRQLGKCIREKGLTIAVGETTFSITGPPKP